jgi:glycosyltransferase involved in cell wall biosynthesis
MMSIEPLGQDAGFSIVIRTYNSARTLGDVLLRLPKFDADELIVVDSGSTDDTIAIAERYGATIVRLHTPFGYSQALNTGFDACSREWVLVLSSHAIPTTDKFMDILRSFVKQAPLDIVLGYGRCSLAPNAVDESANENLYRIIGPSEFHGNGGNALAVYRRAAWERHPFCVQLKTGEDLEWFLWAQRAGLRVARIYGLEALYRNHGSIFYMFRKGWNESSHARNVLGPYNESLGRYCIGFIYGSLHLLKLTLAGYLPLPFLLRQESHLLGAFLANCLGSRSDHSS